MYTIPRESKYPIDFRKDETKELVDNIKRKRSIELIGMKRVGISNFLRFFIYNEKLKAKYFNSNSQTVFISIDLNDLIERELYPFWLLTFKRVVDSSRKILKRDIDKDKINALFEKSIQSNNLFLTIDALRQSLFILIEERFTPVLFFIGFDRLIDIITEDFYSNLQGLRDATNKEVVYIITTLRDLSSLRADIFDKTSLSALLTQMYLKPAKTEDLEIISKTLEIKYDLKLDNKIKNQIYTLSGGHVQYLYLAFVSLYDYLNRFGKFQRDPIEIIKKDERILLQSEELYSSLTENEKKTLVKLLNNRKITDAERRKASYLWDTGIVLTQKKTNKIFSNFYEDYVKLNITSNGDTSNSYLTKKEHVLFEILKKYIGSICERDIILENVWPEYQEVGVSDWAVDRLVARLRKKLEATNSKYSIKTVRTRGFILQEK